VLGERNLYCLRDNGQIRFMKKLEFNPSCFLPYASGTQQTPRSFSRAVRFLPKCESRFSPTQIEITVSSRA
ncbi:hypothetical protein IEQ44_16550, partial [Nocardioides sp. Y6]